MLKRFWKYVDRRGEEECWPWLGCKINRQGYGCFWNGIKQVAAHRASYELFIEPIPLGLNVLHKCDNPPCVNPAHLFLGTQRDNVKDMAAKGRHQSQQKTHCPAGHLLTERKTNGKRFCRICLRRQWREHYRKKHPNAPHRRLKPVPAVSG